MNRVQLSFYAKRHSDVSTKNIRAGRKCLKAQVKIMDIESRVLNCIKEKDVINIVRNLINIPSVSKPPGNQREIADFLSSHLKELGLRVNTVAKEQDKNNIIAVLKDTGKNLLFEGHMDTSDITKEEQASWKTDPFDATIKEGKIFGKGAVDMKGGLASFIIATKAIVESEVELRKGLMLAFYVDEEYGMMSAGSEYVCKQGHLNNVIAALGGEPSDLQLRHVFRGRTIYEITLAGKVTHSSAPDKGVNAIHAMSDLIGNLRKRQLKYEKKYELMGEPTLSFTGIEGGMPGTSPTIPDFCRARLEVRLVPGQTVDDVKRDLEDALQEMRSDIPDLMGEVTVVHRRGPSETPKESELYEAVTKSFKRVRMQEPVLYWGGGAAGDLHWLLEKGVPGIVIGPGPRALAHKPNEFANIGDLVNLSQIFALTALDVCKYC